jgi:hypothetical protein
MTEPVRPLEALIAEKIAEWRSEPNRKTHTHRMADELAVLLQAAAPPAPLSPAPCSRCGYNGPGYYQPDSHACAAPPAPTAEPSGLIGRGESTPMSDEEASAVPDSAHGSVTVNDFVCAVGEMTNEDALRRVKELAAAAPPAPTAELEFQRARADKWVEIAAQRAIEIEQLQEQLAEAAPPERVSEGKE